MCTVSFVHTNEGVIITSNRDEKTARPIALPPEIYDVNDKRIAFPKDPLSGGSWFVVDQDANTAVLLNGARQKHHPTGDYRMSRGLIPLDILSVDDPVKYWGDINLENIEPFTLILFQLPKLYLLRWDGKYKETFPLETGNHYIWSSSTLYSEVQKKRREQWFYDFLNNTKKVSAKDLLSFHQYTEKDDKENGLIIDRKNRLKTLSITQSIIQKDQTAMHYLQLYPKHNHWNIQI